MIHPSSNAEHLPPIDTSKWQGFDFAVELNLQPVINYWRTKKPVNDPQLKYIEAELKKHPKLWQPTRNFDEFEKHQDVLRILFSPMMPSEGWSNFMQAICAPFQGNHFIIATDAYEKVFTKSNYVFNFIGSTIGKGQFDNRALYAYKAILKKFYNLDLKVDQPIIVSWTDKSTGLVRYFKLMGNTRFVTVKTTAPLPKLGSRQVQTLLDQQFDPEAWFKILPPQNFLFSGATITHLMDVTIEQSTNILQFALLNRSGDNEKEWMMGLQQEVRNLFRLPQLRLGITTLQANGELNFKSNNPLWNSLLLRELSGEPDAALAESFYEEIMNTNQTLIIENLKHHPYGQGGIGEEILRANYHNLLITPLHNEGQRVGFLELAVPTPGAINGLSLFKVNQIKPIFANALKRHFEEFENRVEAVMREEFTAIHPTIQWRFRKAAIRMLDSGVDQAPGGSIRFDNLYPFYGSLDIRDSSKKRNLAVSKDLHDNLLAAKEILELAFQHLDLSILDELAFQVRQKIDQLESRFSAGDEVSLAVFIRQRINPVVDHLALQYPGLRAATVNYQKRIDPTSGIFTLHRNAYDQALEQLNQVIVRRLEVEEKKLMKTVPCFFEKYQTDGVEYNIYLGPSLSPKQHFDPLYIDNLHLRQMIWTCQIVREIDALQPRLREWLKHFIDLEEDHPSRGHALQIAPLILSYGSRLSLKFRGDEKRLEVDGSYNIRYEIVKKRIDKSKVKGAGERLTQVGHIAIVYSREEEAHKYRQHMEYLIAQQLIVPDWEELKLEPLQGVEGLRALRVKVRPEN